MRIPAATYRLQLHRGFTFDDARRIVPYLVQLGISDLYLSPWFAARAGSTHGYDICDHSRINPELGGERGYEALISELDARGLGQVLDFVPNHMGIDPATNAWWRDVLENGPSSPFADYFDVDWSPVKAEIRNKVLLPILGDSYGQVLERGELRLEYADGTLRLRYFEHDLPINPRQLPRVLGHDLKRLDLELGEGNSSLREYRAILELLESLPVYTESSPEKVAERQRGKNEARERLAGLIASSPTIAAHVERNLVLFNGRPGDPASFDGLHALLERGAYRLAYWRTAFHEINYRRFFDINDLAGLRMEDPRVFAATHERLIREVRAGRVTALRLDHLDGLYDPAAYLTRLREAVGPLWIVAEKILSTGESLPASWPIQGTSGYDFLNDVNGLFVDGQNAAAMRALYGKFAAHRESFPELAYDAKKLITQTSLASELNVLAYALNRISEGDRRSRDFTLDSLREALREVVACLPVYRTYVSEQGWSDADRELIERAVARARRRNPAMERTIFDFVRSVLLPDPGGAEWRRRIDLAMRVQQYTGPVQAKGVEDTAFYRHGVLLSLNEVGGDPLRFGRTPAEFHEANRRRHRDSPFTLLATATHDTKRGEDARARIDVLSEIPEEWRRAVTGWARLHRRLRSTIDGEPAPDRNEEYVLYQCLIGVWPPEGAQTDPGQLVGRLEPYLQKALREAKVHSSWTNVNEEWERAVVGFAKDTLLGPTAGRFLAMFRPFQRRIAFLGMLNSLSQLVLKVCSPGVADFYQGTELWDLSLVDPDNRRPVDYPLRARLLDEIEPALDELAATETRGQTLAKVLAEWPDGRIKLLVTAAGLRLRKARPDLFLRGEYVALETRGAHAAHLVALLRVLGDDCALAIVPCRVAALLGTNERLPIGEGIWKDTRLVLPPRRYRDLRNVLTGETLEEPTAGEIPVGKLLRTAPVGLFLGRTIAHQSTESSSSS